MLPANQNFVVSEEMLLPQNIPELLANSPNLRYLYNLTLETPLDTQSAQGFTPDPPSSHVLDPLDLPPRIPTPVGGTTRICAICSASTSVPPSTPPSRAMTLPPRNWHMIPQVAYNHGEKQWDFTPSECISFEVDRFPGLNLGDALRKSFTGLVGRDDLVLRDTPKAISCRLLVRLS